MHLKTKNLLRNVDPDFDRKNLNLDPDQLCGLKSGLFVPPRFGSGHAAKKVNGSLRTFGCNSTVCPRSSDYFLDIQ